ncbi:MAG: zf-TFIIB domain-containing protein [Elusimicrobia bacterium]|nr:zf-TFIIB domain-containing protein [Elusimicrobiota bacterium]
MAFCPSCRVVDMDTLTTPQGVVVDECPECGGRWFDAGELEAVSKDPAKMRAAVADDKDDKPSERVCPRCTTKLIDRALLSRFLRVDYCAGCRGFWVVKTDFHIIDKLLGA